MSPETRPKTDQIRKRNIKTGFDHTIIHFEIPANDVERLRDFYSKLFGWKISRTSSVLLSLVSLVCARAAKTIAAYNRKKSVNERDIREAAELVVPHRVRRLPFEEPKPVTQRVRAILREKKRPDKNKKAGEKIVLAVRPEALELHSGHKKVENALHGRIKIVKFEGTITRYDVKLENEDLVVVTRPSLGKISPSHLALSLSDKKIVKVFRGLWLIWKRASLLAISFF
jgi:hypothetical protein